MGRVYPSPNVHIHYGVFFFICLPFPFPILRVSCSLFTTDVLRCSRDILTPRVSGLVASCIAWEEHHFFIATSNHRDIWEGPRYGGLVVICCVSLPPYAVGLLVGLSKLISGFEVSRKLPPPGPSLRCCCVAIIAIHDRGFHWRVCIPMPESSKKFSSPSKSLYYSLSRCPPLMDLSLAPDNKAVDT